MKHFLIGMLLFGLALPAAVALEPQIEKLWPNTPPGPPALVKGDEQDMTKPEDRLISGKPIIKLGNVIVDLSRRHRG